MKASRAAALGAVQGVAEVVPVSSSAQLVLVPWLLGWEQPSDRTGFAAGLHAGSCAGIAWALRDELRALTRSDVLVLGAASLPAAVAGLLAGDVVEQRLGRPSQLAALLAGAGVVMWAADAVAARCHQTAASPRAHGVAPRHGLVAGVAQVAALVPGVSRSGATLTALRLSGVDRAEAERFSLLLSLPVTAGAAGLTLVRARRRAPGQLTGTVVAALTAAAATRALRTRPGRPLRSAALYRLGLAAVVARRLTDRRE